MPHGSQASQTGGYTVPRNRIRAREVQPQANSVEAESTYIGTQARGIGPKAGHIGGQADGIRVQP